MEPRTLVAFVLIGFVIAMMAFGIFRMTRKARRDREIYYRRWMRSDDARSDEKPGPSGKWSGSGNLISKLMI